VQEGAKGSDAGARTDHDDRRGLIGGQAEVVRGLDVGRQCIAGPYAIGEKGGRDTQALPVTDTVTHGIDREMQPARHGFRA
jgi:hypothetical protein